MIGLIRRIPSCFVPVLPRNGSSPFILAGNFPDTRVSGERRFPRFKQPETKYETTDFRHERHPGLPPRFETHVPAAQRNPAERPDPGKTGRGRPSRSPRPASPPPNRGGNRLPCGSRRSFRLLWNGSLPSSPPSPSAVPDPEYSAPRNSLYAGAFCGPFRRPFPSRKTFPSFRPSSGGFPKPVNEGLSPCPRAPAAECKKTGGAPRRRLSVVY